MTHQDRVAELLSRTAEAHHRAFAATDGADPDWPAWYASYLLENGFEDLAEDSTMSATDLSRLLIEADTKHRAEAQETPWELFYADLLRARAGKRE